MGNRRRRRSKIGLALAGGGPVGAVYEVGALRALEEALEGVEFTALESWVGVSAGAFVSACLANGLGPAQLVRMLFRHEPGDVPFDPATFFVPAYGELARRGLMLPKLVAESVLRYATRRDRSLSRAALGLGRALPVGLFDNEPIRAYVEALFSQAGRSDDFRALGGRLTVVGADLGTGQPIAFGSPEWAHVPISRAVQASTAVPGVYTPVRIDGRDCVDGALVKTVHASAVLDRGVDLLLVLNPIVPIDTTLERRGGARGGRTHREHDLVGHGLPAVLSQATRTLLHSRMQLALSGYAARYEGTDVALFEPGREEYGMFFANLFSFRSREQICELAYTATRRDLLARRDSLEPLLARHGIRLRTDVLEDDTRTLWEGVGLRPARRATPPLHELERALAKLEAAVAA